MMANPSLITHLFLILNSNKLEHQVSLSIFICIPTHGTKVRTHLEQRKIFYYIEHINKKMLTL